MTCVFTLEMGLESWRKEEKRFIGVAELVFILVSATTNVNRLKSSRSLSTYYIFLQSNSSTFAAVEPAMRSGTAITVHAPYPWLQLAN